MIDAHGHLNLDEFASDWQDVLDRSRTKGIRAVIVPGTDYVSSQRAIELATQRPGMLFAAVGLHPNALHEEVFSYERYHELAQDPSVVAIGEVGLDTYRNPNHLAAQQRVLEEFLRLAATAHKPLIFHVRAGRIPGEQISGQDPHDVLLKMLSNQPHCPPFVVHCYQGTSGQAERYLALGGYLSFTGTITYGELPVVRETLALVPLERMLIETDSPFLSPVPYRGERNEPWKVIEVARRIAKIKQCDLAEVTAQTMKNTTNLFRLSGIV